MNTLTRRRVGTAGLATAAVAGVLAGAPAANAAPASDSARHIRCSTVITASARSAASTATTRCTRDGRRVAPPAAGKGVGTAVKPGAARSGGSRTAESRGWISTSLHFHNYTANTVVITIQYYAPDSCAGQGGWGKKGWWNVAPGGEVNVLNTGNRYATFYAHSSRLSWSGGYNALVPPTGFDWCQNTGDTQSSWVGERLVDLGAAGVLPYTTYTVNLTG